MCKYQLCVVVLTLIVCEYLTITQAFRIINENGIETILALANEHVLIECRTDMPMRYCGFIHPSGKRYSFTGLATNVGKCSVKIKATANDAGAWRCHIGSPSAGVEGMKVIQLRVVGEIAAVQSNISAVHGKSMTLYCTTTKGFIPLSYCRFEPPNGLPFSIDSSVTEAKPLLKRYYFPSNKSLDRGDCAVTIRKVKYVDVGTWTCGAGLDDGNEYIDVMNFQVEGLYTMSNASATGITFGTISIIAVLSILGFVAWKKRRLLGSPQRRDDTQEGQEMEQMPPVPASSPPHSPYLGRTLPSIQVQSPSEPSEPGASTPLVSRSFQT